MKKLVMLATALVLSGCAASPQKLAAQDEAFCSNLLCDKALYLQCRQHQQDRREQQAAADSAARSQALYRFGEALSATGDAMRTTRQEQDYDDAPATAPRTQHCRSTWSSSQRAQHPGDLICTTD
jgi:hypothetical protein